MSYTSRPFCISPARACTARTASKETIAIRTAFTLISRLLLFHCLLLSQHSTPVICFRQINFKSQFAIFIPGDQHAHCLRMAVLGRQGEILDGFRAILLNAFSLGVHLAK